MIVYRLVEPVDELGDLLTLPEYLAVGAAESTRWAIRALLELADTADEPDWRGDMRHLLSVASASDGTACLIVKQDDDGAAFLVSAQPAGQVRSEYGYWSRAADAKKRDIPEATHPTARQFAQVTRRPADDPRWTVSRHCEVCPGEPGL